MEHFFVFFLISLLNGNSLINRVTGLTNNSSSKTNEVYEKEKDVHNSRPNGEWIGDAFFEAMSTYAPWTDEKNSQCTDHANLYKIHLRNLTRWAVQMYDATIHSPSGLIVGDTNKLGNFEECLNVSYPVSDVKGKYCLVTMKYGPSRDVYSKFYTPPDEAYYEDPPVDSPIWDKIKRTKDRRMYYRDEFLLGVCVPAACSHTDIQTTLNETISRKFSEHHLYGEVFLNESNCYVQGEEKYDTGFYIVIFVISILSFLAIAGTIFDYFFKSDHRNNCTDVGLTYTDNQEDNKSITEPGKVEELFLSFSMRANFNELVSVGVDPNLNILNGIKVITIIAIIFGHRGLFSFGFNVINPESIEPRYLDKTLMAFMNSTHLVDTFFFLSGLLTFKGIYDHLNKTKRLTFSIYFINRYLRFIPLYAMMMAIYAFVIRHMVSGPYVNMNIGRQSDICRETWWHNILFINNYFSGDKQCILMAWYLACDMHYFIISIFLIYAYWKSEKLGKILIGLTLVLSMASTFAHYYIGKFDGKLKIYPKVLNSPFTDHNLKNAYIKSHVRAIPYIIGIITSIITHEIGKHNYTIPKMWVYLGLPSMFFGYGIHSYSLILYIPGRPYSAIENAMLAVILPIAWALSNSWIIIAEEAGNLGFYKWLFGQYIYTPFSRLIFCVMLAHPLVQTLQTSSELTPTYHDLTKSLWMTGSDFMASHVVAILLYLIVEAPFKNMQKKILLPLFDGGRRARRPIEDEQGISNQNPRTTIVPIMMTSLKDNTIVKKSNGITDSNQLNTSISKYNEH